jgi:hypothetical protein
VESNFNVVYGNGWELQLSKNKDPKIAAVMAALGVTGPFFHCTLTEWMISTEKPCIARQDEGEMVRVPSPTRRQGFLYDRTAPGPVPMRLKPLFLVSTLLRDLSIFSQKLGECKGGGVD